MSGAETKERVQEDSPPLEDTAAPVEVHDAKMDILHMEEALELLPQQEEAPAREESSPITCTFPSNQHEDGVQILPQQEAASVRDQCPQVADTSLDGGDEEEANRLIRRSLFVPPKFTERLVRPQEHHLEHQRGCQSVMMYRDSAKEKLHGKGGKDNMLACCAALRASLAELR